MTLTDFSKRAALSLLLSFCWLSLCWAIYDRADWGDWADPDGNGRCAREDVLVRDSLIPPGFDATGRVASGLWVCPYTGEVFTDPAKLDIDHIVPLKEAYSSGAWAWPEKRMVEYYNDPDNLLSVRASANRSKGSKDVAEWMPPNRAYWREYLEAWARVKLAYGLSADKAEAIAFFRLNEVADDYEYGDSIERGQDWFD